MGNVTFELGHGTAATITATHTMEKRQSTS
jgi:hypothetical protein